VENKRNEWQQIQLNQSKKRGIKKRKDKKGKYGFGTKNPLHKGCVKDGDEKMPPPK
jgi:hypothetical protein